MQTLILIVFIFLIAITTFAVLDKISKKLDVLQADIKKLKKDK